MSRLCRDMKSEIFLIFSSSSSLSCLMLLDFLCERLGSDFPQHYKGCDYMCVLQFLISDSFNISLDIESGIEYLMHLRRIIYYFYFASSHATSPSSQDCTDKRCVGVSYMQRLCRPLPGFSYFLTLLLLRMSSPLKIWLFDILRMRLINKLYLWCI